MPAMEQLPCCAGTTSSFQSKSAMHIFATCRMEFSIHALHFLLRFHAFFCFIAYVQLFWTWNIKIHLQDIWALQKLSTDYIASTSGLACVATRSVTFDLVKLVSPIKASLIRLLDLSSLFTRRLSLLILLALIF